MLTLVLMSSRLVDQEEGVWRPRASRGNWGQGQKGRDDGFDRQGLADLLMCAIDIH